MQTINKHTNVVDFALQQHGSVAALFAICMANNASITDELIPGTTWQLAEGEFENIEVAITKYTPPTAGLQLKNRQNLSDFVTQQTGDIAGLFTTAKMNGLSITQEVAEGTILSVFAMNSKVINYLKDMSVDIVSAQKASLLQPGGIGFMQIGTSFIVS